MYKPSKKLMIVQIFLIFILPVFLLYFKILPSNWHIIMLSVSFLLIYGIIHHENWSYEEMGLRHDNFKKAFPFYLFFTFLSIGILFLIDYKLNMPGIESKLFIFKTLILFLPVSFFQEFAFRSFLIPRLKEIYNNNFIIILMNAFLFTLIHIIYPSLGISLPLAFISGVFFSWLYLKYPNLILVFISHSILNVTAVLLGFFNIH